MLFNTFLLGLILQASLTLAHYNVIGFKANNKLWNGWNICYWGKWSDLSRSVIRPMDCVAPLEDVTSPALACSYRQTDKKRVPATIQAPVKAGSKVTFYWSEIQHPGPMMVYMARCPGSCKKFIPGKNDKVWFKIAQAGYYNNKWANEHARANNNTWTVTIPADIRPGNYLIRPESLALHMSNKHQTQHFLSCIEAKVSGKGKANPPNKVAFPGAYKRNDPGIYIPNYWWGFSYKDYKFPGPKVYKPKKSKRDFDYEEEYADEDDYSQINFGGSSDGYA